VKHPRGGPVSLAAKGRRVRACLSIPLGLEPAFIVIAALAASPAAANDAGPADAGDERAAGAVTAPTQTQAELDARIRRRVESVLGRDPDAVVQELRVEVQAGIVTLYGKAPTPADKQLAGRYADDVPGTVGVVNGIDVVPGLRPDPPQPDGDGPQ
jgi:hypothetical protein